MAYTSSKVKARYNSKVYDVISTRIPKDIAAQFKEACKERGISQAQVIKEAMQQFINEKQP